MAEESMENYEDKEEKPSKKGLILSIIAFLLVIALLAVGVVLFFIIRDRREGEINIEGANINIEATSQIEGMANPPVLAPIVINTEDDTPTSSRWEHVNLVFENADQIITVYITIVNNNSLNELQLVYDNATTKTNLIIDDFYYRNTNSGVLNDIENQDPVYVPARESVTFVATFQVADANNSVNDVLNITITCNNIEM